MVEIEVGKVVESFAGTFDFVNSVGLSQKL